MKHEVQLKNINFWRMHLKDSTRKKYYHPKNHIFPLLDKLKNNRSQAIWKISSVPDNLKIYTDKLRYDGPLSDAVLSMTDDMLGPSPMHIKYVSYVYDGFCIRRTNFPGPIESVTSKFACNLF